MSFLYIKALGLMILLSFEGCGGGDLPPQEDPIGDGNPSYEQSWNTWLDLKKSNGDDYTYTATETSWTGAGSHTYIEVTNGKVTSRSYEGYEISTETGETTVIETFEEAGSEIGQDQRGARPLTIDQLYQLCLTQYIAVDEEENEVFFETFEDGIVSLCGYVPKSCADDCYEGFSLSDFEWR